MRQKAFISGASSGIGKELARQLAESGYELILLGRDIASLETLRQELAKKTSVSVHSLDLKDQESVERACSLVRKSIPHLVVNCAGIGFYGAVTDLPLQDQKDTIQVNVSALVTLTIAACSALKEAGREGVVCNVSSALGMVPCPLMSVYSGSKAFVNSFSQAVDGEMRPFGIRVLAACPGQVATNFRTRAAKGEKTNGGSSFFVMQPQYVAKKILEQIQKKRATFIIDWKTACLVWLSYILPRRCVNKILSHRVPSAEKTHPQT
jgi:short-subunit dehydrogenase